MCLRTDHLGHTLGAHRTVQLADPFPTMVHYFAMDILKSKNTHPALEVDPKQLWAHKYDVGLIKDATGCGYYRPNKQQTLCTLFNEERWKFWRPVHDLCAENKAVFAQVLVVFNPATI